MKYIQSYCTIISLLSAVIEMQDRFIFWVHRSGRESRAFELRRLTVSRGRGRCVKGH